MKTFRIVAICVVIAAVLALTGLGRRGFHWFPVFILWSGFLVGVALLADKMLTAVGNKTRWPDNSN